MACALDIFGKIPNDTLIVIHDYDRIEYHVVEDYYLYKLFFFKSSSL